MKSEQIYKDYIFLNYKNNNSSIKDYILVNDDYFDKTHKIFEKFNPSDISLLLYKNIKDILYYDIFKNTWIYTDKEDNKKYEIKNLEIIFKTNYKNFNNIFYIFEEEIKKTIMNEFFNDDEEKKILRYIRDIRYNTIEDIKIKNKKIKNFNIFLKEYLKNKDKINKDYYIKYIIRFYKDNCIHKETTDKLILSL